MLLVSIPDAARLTDRNRRTIYHWISRGVVRVRYLASGHRRVVVDDLVRVERPDLPVKQAVDVPSGT